MFNSTFTVRLRPPARLARLYLHERNFKSLAESLRRCASLHLRRETRRDACVGSISHLLNAGRPTGPSEPTRGEAWPIFTAP